MPGRASTDWLVTRDSWSPKLRYASRQVGRWRYDRMSILLSVPGCGMQSRVFGAGSHGKTESKSAGSSPSPVRYGVVPGASRNFTARAVGSPRSILARSRPYAPMPANVSSGANSRVDRKYAFGQTPYFG